MHVFVLVQIMVFRLHLICVVQLVNKLLNMNLNEPFFFSLGTSAMIKFLMSTNSRNHPDLIPQPP